MKSGRLNEAIADFEEALKISPNLAQTHNGLALALADSGDFDAAIEHFHKALDIWPNDAEACNNLATALYYTGQHDAAKLDEAISYLQRSLALKPDFTAARQNLAAVKQARAALLRGSGRHSPAAIQVGWADQLESHRVVCLNRRCFFFRTSMSRRWDSLRSAHPTGFQLPSIANSPGDRPVARSSPDRGCW
jgi:tetratricopeptide (TPR) repeat protein